jgi:hypothetical protein
MNEYVVTYIESKDHRRIGEISIRYTLTMTMRALGSQNPFARS